MGYRISVKVRLFLVVSAFFILGMEKNGGSESYEEREMTSRFLIMPELDQFYLGSRLFFAASKKAAAWKAYQTFVYNYPKSELAAAAQFMIAESIFLQAVSELKSGNAPDEANWRHEHPRFKFPWPKSRNR